MTHGTPKQMNQQHRVLVKKIQFDAPGRLYSRYQEKSKQKVKDIKNGASSRREHPKPEMGGGPGRTPASSLSFPLFSARPHLPEVGQAAGVISVLAGASDSGVHGDIPGEATKRQPSSVHFLTCWLCGVQKPP